MGDGEFLRALMAAWRAAWRHLYDWDTMHGFGPAFYMQARRKE